MPTLYDTLERHRDDPNDKRVFGLVLQGGGMRGVYSAGAVTPLSAYGFVDAFDHVIGSSAGALNGAYFIANRPNAYGPYINDLANKTFVDLLRKDKKVDVDYAIDVALKQKHPLDIDMLLTARAKLHVLLTAAESGRKVVLSDHKDFSEIYEEFRATAAIPILYDKKVLVGGKYYVDGAVADIVPVDVAVKLGCTDIIVVMTQQASTFRFDRRHTRLVNHLIKKMAKNHTAAVRRKLPTDERLLQVNLRLMRQPHRKLRIYVLEPSREDENVGLTTIDSQKIEAFAKLGITDMDAFLHKQIEA